MRKFQNQSDARVRCAPDWNETIYFITRMRKVRRAEAKLVRIINNLDSESVGDYLRPEVGAPKTLAMAGQTLYMGGTGSRDSGAAG